ncbi:hypothetical protein G6F65_020002 [Rhizopus arrhizus]|nr:hypothetical protein G6F23_014781 [Rhizopus arrhizus]KAG1247739.1 hypothetical protein G6F65_020002 [Rhizopus arrhizus]
MHRQLHRGGIATRVADVFLAVVAVAGQLRQTVVPAVVEAVIGREIDDDGLRPGRFQRSHERCGQAIGQGQDHRVHALGGHRVSIQALVLQIALELRVMVRQALPGALARGHEGQFQARVCGHQLDQLGAGMAAGTDDAQGESRIVHA